jgi:RNA methyltransferase, TrmH family
MNGNARAATIQALISRVRSLSERRNRDRANCHWIEGIRNFVWAHDAGRTFDLIVHSPVLLQNDCADMLCRRLKTGGVPRQSVRPEEFRAMSGAMHASGIGAIVRQHWQPLDALAIAPDRCFLVIEQIESRGNLGTILRTAEACGCAGVVFLGDRSDPFDPAVVRASMGGLLGLALVRTTTPRLAAWAKSRGVRMVALSPRAERLWTDLPSGVPLAFVIGEERRGLSQAQTALCDWSVRLPIVGRADSLNVGVAAGVAMYEMVRRSQSR